MKWGGRRAQAWTTAVLDRYGSVCLLALPGCTELATTGDHVIPKSERPDLAYDVTNGRPACRPCNSRRGTDPLDRVVLVDNASFFDASATREGLRPTDLPPNIHGKRGTVPDSIEPRRVVLVCGPPGSGKTTRAHELAAEGLRVFDRDDDQWSGESHFVAAAREYCARPDARAVVIRAGATSRARARAVRQFAPSEVELLMVDQDELHRRITTRGRPGQSHQHRACREWFARYNADMRVQL